MKHILVTTDFSAESETAFSFVQEYLTLLGKERARCSILAVLEDLARKSKQMQLAMTMLEGHGIRDELRKQAEESIEALKNKYFAGFSVQTVISKAEKSVDTEILAFAAEHDVDMIVIATHGRTGMSHMFLGSVSEKVVRQSKCPVVVVPVQTGSAGQPKDAA